MREERSIFTSLLTSFISLVSLSAFTAQDPCLCLSLPTWTNNQVHFGFPGEDGTTYFVESSTDLQNWVRISTNTGPAATRVVILDAPAGANFYRIATARPLKRSAGLVVLQGLSFQGNNVSFDAFDSS